MKNMIIVAAALMSAVATASLAQTTPSSEGDTPAVATPDAQNPAAPVAGANSFTEAQAKARIEEAGYTEVSSLKLDDKGVWQATAMKDGKSVSVALDYQGNITAQ
ncbi:PepSY domain-containing protein [Sinorhizobium sp. 7-81]|uniref:PepSY domain-containing protein n=1 Tax=Sinorhizobium sp. 8-89 TaxID=3049089 RepID=UPI0024C21206|nr:PepSY domain-containing protein [Sinorhizobium sp. 8-89]MDK1494853.1 PepSY domain-containing protein [Sinorhizobium sp. 8-89]